MDIKCCRPSTDDYMQGRSLDADDAGAAAAHTDIQQQVLGRKCYMMK